MVVVARWRDHLCFSLVLAGSTQGFLARPSAQSSERQEVVAIMTPSEFQAAEKKFEIMNLQSDMVYRQDPVSVPETYCDKNSSYVSFNLKNVTASPGVPRLGCALAHWEAWKRVSKVTRRRTLILEADFEPVASRNMLRGALQDALHTRTEDFVQLGHCGEFCAHAYVISVELAALLSKIPPCAYAALAIGFGHDCLFAVLKHHNLLHGHFQYAYPRQPGKHFGEGIILEGLTVRILLKNFV